VAVARASLDEFEPDWVSFQFVCYAYHPKGIVHGLSARLAPLYKGRKTHFMLHELWLCKEQGWGWKHCLVGAVQRRFVLQFARDAKPSAIHTSNACYADCYAEILKRSGIRAEMLGLFGNVPVVAAPGSEWIESELRAALGADYRREKTWLFGLFGSPWRQWPPEPLLTILPRAAKAAGKRVALLSIGRLRDEGLEVWNRMVRDYSDRIAFVRLNEQPAERVSEFLSWVDYGIATTPPSIIGKSGTAVSMLEHGLPVIVNRADTPGAETVAEENELQFIPCDGDLERRLAGGVARGPRGSRCPKVARAFADALERASASAPLLIHQ
jgi:hypothetical protein